MAIVHSSPVGLDIERSAGDVELLLDSNELAVHSQLYEHDRLLGFSASRLLGLASARYLIAILSLWVVSCGGISLDEVGQTGQKLSPANWPSEALVVTNSAQLEDRVQLQGGIAAVNVSNGAVLASQAELVVGFDARIEGDVRADSLVLQRGTLVTGFAHYNTLTGEGIAGSLGSPLALPLAIALPGLPAMAPGTQNIVLGPSQNQSISAGAYRNATLASGNGGVATVLTLNGGVYEFLAVTLGNDARLECASTCEVRVKGRFKTGARSYVGLGASASGDPSDVQIFVAGPNGGPMPRSTPAAAFVDNDSELGAFVLVPNGTLWLGHRVKFTGKIVAKDALLGADVHAEVKRAKAAWVRAPINLDATTEYDQQSIYSEDGNQTAPSAPGTSFPAEARSASAVPFTIPDHLNVTSGNAGNGEAVLTYTDQTGVLVTCTYRGAASVEHPTEELDRMKGMRYVFESCDNGSQANDAARGTSFKAEVISGDSAPPYGETAIGLSLGEGCHDTLDAAMSGADVVALKQEFKWDQVDNLNETDPDGHPAIWHGLIYIEQKRQIEALNRWGILWSAMPLSYKYQEKYAGKCGRVEHATDGKGVVIYAIFPAKFYNIMRDFALQAQEAEIAPPFRFIIPSSPDQAEFVNSDGSLRYQALSDSGYQQWLANRSQLQPGWFDDVTSWVSTAATDAYDWVVGAVETGVDGVETGLGYATASWDEVVDFTANALDDAFEYIQQGLQEVTLIFRDEIRVRLNVRLTELDPQIGLPELRRMWGPRDAAGNLPLVVPTGASVRVRQWFSGAVLIPLMGQDTMDDNGRVNIKAVRGAPGQHGDAICVELEAPYASISTDLIPNEVCNFTNVVDFTQSVDVDMPIAQEDLYSLGQFKDSADYSNLVIGHDPAHAQVLIGWTANTLTSSIAGGRRAMTLCLDFPGTSSTMIAAGLITLPYAVTFGVTVANEVPIVQDVVGPVTARVSPLMGVVAYLALLAEPFYMKDIWWPDSAAKRSRGVATHEFGHFDMCSMIVDDGGIEALTGLITRLSDGEEARDDDYALMLETIADEFTMQVAGGVNYVELDQARDSMGRMNFCTASPCIDVNRNGTDDHPYRFVFDGRDAAGMVQTHVNPWLDEHARWQTLVRDAFDTLDGSTRGTLAPGNGDYWEEPGPACLAPTVVPGTANDFECLTPGCVLQLKQERQPPPVLPVTVASCVRPLQPAAASFLTNDDERVALPGAAWREWIAAYLDRSRGGLSDSFFEYAPSSGAVIGGLTDVMRARSNWCDACEVVAIHSPAASAAARMSMDPLEGAVGAGPRTFALRHERFQVCAADAETRSFVGPPPREDLQIDANCTACRPLEFANLTTGACEPCPAGSVPLPRGATLPVPQAAPGTNDQCMVCPGGTVPAPNNLCNACQPNEISVGGVCVACDTGTTPDAALTQCVPCSVDAVVDWTDFVDDACSNGGAFPVEPGPGDTCPTQLVLDVQNLQPEAAEGIQLGLVGEGPLGPLLSEELCAETSAEVAGFSVDAGGNLNGLATTGLNPADVNDCSEAEAQGLICGTCSLPATVDVTGPQVVSAAHTVRVVGRVDGPAPGAVLVRITSIGDVGGSDCVK